MGNGPSRSDFGQFPKSLSPYKREESAKYCVFCESQSLHRNVSEIRKKYAEICRNYSLIKEGEIKIFQSLSGVAGERKGNSRI